MKSTNSEGYSIIALLVVVITQFVIRSIGIDNMSVQVFIALLFVACFLTMYGINKDKEKGFGIKNNTIIEILLVVTCISSAIMVIILKGYPTLADRYGVLLVIISAVAFFALVLFIIICRIIYEKKRK